MNSIDELRRVIDGGYCIGCGICSAVQGSPVTVEMNSLGMMQARLEPILSQEMVPSAMASVCPFSDGAANETEIARDRFGAECSSDSRIGLYVATFAGYVTEGTFRETGSSGGFGSWIQNELLKAGLVDAVIHVRGRSPTPSDSRLYEYSVVRDVHSIQTGAKSRYYPIEVGSALKMIRGTNLKYALVGLPCFIKAVQLLRRHDREICNAIPYCVGLVCGHLKSARFAESFAWQMGISPSELQKFDFRKKLQGAPASQYAVEAVGVGHAGEVVRSRSSKELLGSDWGLDFFKYKAFDDCDDVLAETADVTIGDAWLPQYVNDSNGTNILVIRNRTLMPMFDAALQSERIILHPISANDVAASQDAGLRHRRDGLAYRLYLADRNNTWRPKKRVQASSSKLGFLGKRKFVNRMKIREKSHEIFDRARRMNNIEVFLSEMRPIASWYYNSLNPFWYRVLRRVKRSLKRR